MGKPGVLALALQLLLGMMSNLPTAWANNTGGLEFDGDEAYVTFGQATSTLGASNFTLEIWFKRTGAGERTSSGTGGISAVPLVTKGRGQSDGDTRDMNYFLGINAGGVLVADFEEGVGGSGPLGLNHPVVGSTATTTGIWYHAAVTYDGASWALYLNGNLETNLFVGQPPRWDSIQHAALGSALDSSGTPQGYFEGVLDEARIWNYARSAEQIAGAVNQQIGSAPGLIGRWGLNEGSGTVAFNSVSGSPDGTLIDDPIWCLGYPFPPGTNIAPDVAIVSPTNGAALIASTDLIISASAADIDGTVTDVAFLRDGVGLGVVTTRPFSVVWSNITAGSYSFVAVATDDGGLTTTSAVVNITVTKTNFSPRVETVQFPANGTNNVSLSPVLSITASDPETNDITVTFFGRVAVTRPDFSIVVLPDTQYYSKSYPGIFRTQTDWIINNRTNLNIRYVAQLGDLTDDGNALAYEWVNATNALYRLEDPAVTGIPEGIPYGVVPGNHDHAGGGTGLYNAYFGASHFSAHSYYGGNLGGNNQNHYDLITAGGMDFVIVYLDFNYTYLNYGPIDAWANSVLQSNANRRAIVVSHCILEGDGSYDDSRSPSVYSSLKANTNVFLMLCGHNYREARRQDSYQGNTITTCLSDYQFDANGGNGFLRLYQFSPTNNLVRVKTYSPYLNQYETDANSQFQFGYQMSGSVSGSYFVVGATNVPSGTAVNVTWPGLTPATEYEWYVTLDDGTNQVRSPTWRFTTTATGTNTAPTVALTQPPNGTIILAGTNVTLEATASDTEGFITRVDFLANGTNLGSTAGPFSLVLSNLAAGVYGLTAVAFDSGGLTATSTPVALIVTNAPTITNTFIPAGSTWRYLDNGSNQGTNWIDLAFDDSPWSAGPAELGYGDAADGRPEATIVGYGPDPTNKYITTYFRRTFVVTNVASVAALNLRVIRDDGIVVYLNGTGVYTNNMPDTFAFDTYAPDTIDGADEDSWQVASLPPNHLREGTNVVAVEIHQADITSDDLSFDLALSGIVPVALNLPPVANSRSTNVAAEAAVDLMLSGWDPNGDPLSFVVTSGPAHGFLSGFDSQTGAVTYRPGHGFAGPDTFRFAASDGTNTSIEAVITIQIVALPDSNSNGLPDAWETAHSVTDPDADDDSDGFTNRQEYEAGTDPHDASSALRIIDACLDPTNGWFAITWSSVGGTHYRVCYTDGDGRGSWIGPLTEIARPASVEIDPVLTGVHSTQTFTDDFTLTGGPPAHGARYFRVKVVR